MVLNFHDLFIWINMIATKFGLLQLCFRDM